MISVVEKLLRLKSSRLFRSLLRTLPMMSLLPRNKRKLQKFLLRNRLLLNRLQPSLLLQFFLSFLRSKKNPNRLLHLNRRWSRSRML